MLIHRIVTSKANVSHIIVPPTVSSSRFEACEGDSVDEHLSLLHPRVHEQSGVPFGAHPKDMTPKRAVLHPALCLIKGGPSHHHRTWHPFEEMSGSEMQI